MELNVRSFLETVGVGTFLAVAPMHAQAGGPEVLAQATSATTQHLNTVLTDLAGPDAQLLCVRDGTHYYVAVPNANVNLGNCNPQTTTDPGVSLCVLDATLPGLHPLTADQQWRDCATTTIGPVTTLQCAREDHDVPPVINTTVVDDLKKQYCTQ